MYNGANAQRLRARRAFVGIAVLILAVTVIPASGAQTAPAIPGQGIILQNGGDGPDFDTTLYRGKFFNGVTPGTIVETCAYFGGAYTVNIAIKTGPDGGPIRHQLAISSPGLGWHCDYKPRAWSFNSLFIYNWGGGAVGSSGSPCPGDGYGSYNGGSTWFWDGCARRGYRLKIVPSVLGVSPPTNQTLAMVYENGGVGAPPTYEGVVAPNLMKGKFFSDVTPGLITHVCAFFEAGSTNLGLSMRPNLYGEPTTLATAIITATTPGWNCASTSIAWEDTSVLVYRWGGDGRISFTTGCGDGYYYNNNWPTDPPTGWQDNCQKWAYMLVFARLAADVGTDTTVHAGALAALRITASGRLSPEAVAGYGSQATSWLEDYRMEWEDAIEAAQGGNLARPINQALDAPNLSPPMPVLVGSGQQDGFVRVQSNPDPNAPRTPHCYGFETHNGPFTEPVQGCWPIAP